MNRVILMSIRPEWLVKILKGEKTIEIRKTIPKCELPIDVYLYCTKKQRLNAFKFYGKVGFIIDNYELGYYEKLNGKVVAKFRLKKVDEIFYNLFGYGMYKKPQKYIDEVMEKSCINNNQLEKYLNNKNGYAWHIDDLIIFDKPMELSEFETSNIPDNAVFESRDAERYFYLPKQPAWHFYSMPLKKAPQSWQYLYIGFNLTKYKFQRRYGNDTN